MVNSEGREGTVYIKNYGNLYEITIQEFTVHFM